MKPFTRIISIITLICFTLANISLAQDANSFKLSPPSSFSNLKGPEFKEAAQIQVGIRTALKDAQGFSIDSIKILGKRQFIEKSVFGRRIEGTIHFDEIAECRIEGKQIYIEKGSFIFRANTTGGKDYYCLVSTKKNGADYDISVVSERVISDALKGGAIKFTYESVDKKDKKILDLYTEHEISTAGNIAIDPWIEGKMLRGEYAVDDETVKTPPYQHASRKKYRLNKYTTLVADISKLLETIGVKAGNVGAITDTMLSIPLVFVPFKNDDELPIITMGGEKIRVKAHSSQFATYVFLPEELYAKVVKNEEWDGALTTLVEDRLTHEIGTRCGLKVTVQNGYTLNLLDSAVANYRLTPAHKEPLEASSEIRELKPVNLLELELRNDYAAGYSTKKSIFERAMALVVAVILGGQINGFGAELQIPATQAPAFPFTIAASIGTPKESVNAAAQLYQFAHKYTVEGVAWNQKEAEAFMREYFKWESEFYKSIRINGIAMDGFNLKEDTLKPAQIRDWTAASKECLDLAVQLKILTGNKYGIRLTGHNDAGAARQTAIKILKEKMDMYEEYSRSFPAFGSFLPWITIRDGKIQPTSDWSDRLPALDNGEWAWSLYTIYHTLKNVGENDLAVRYKRYFEMLVKNAPSIIYDTNLRKIRAEVKIRNPKARSVDLNNYSNNIAGYYLDDCYEGMMMVSFLTLFTDLPKSEKDHIWDDIKMEKVTTKYGTTYKGWPPQSPLDGSPHIKWAFMFLPFTDNPAAKKVYLLQEKIRTNIHKYGIPVSTNTPGAIGYTAYEPNVFGLYGPFSMIFGQTLQGNVTQNNYGLAWFLNVLQADRMQGPLGSGESISVKPGTNQLEEISTVTTVDGKMILWLAMMGGIQNETREALKRDGLYDRFMMPVNRLYAATFGDASSVQDNAQFRLPQKPIVGRYVPKVHEQTIEMIDLSAFWQYPALDKWGDKTAVRIDGNKMIIEHKPGAEGGWGWAGGSLRRPLTPGKGSAIYFKGKGNFTLKLEGKNKEVERIDVSLIGEDKWTKVPLDTAVGKTFFVIAIDRVMGNIVIADRFYSPDGKVPDKSAPPAHLPITTPFKKPKKEEIKRIEGEAGKIPAEEVKRRAKTENDAIKKAQIRQEAERAAETKKSKITAKQGKVDLMSVYNLSPNSNWGPALVSKSGNTLTIKHNVKKSGYGWSWAGENLRGSYILKENEGIRIEGKGKFTLKLEGSEIVMRPVDLDKTGVVIINDLPKGLKILRIVIDKVMYGTTVEIESMEIINTKTQSSSMYHKLSVTPDPIRAQMDTIGADVDVSKIGSMAKRVDQITEILWNASLGYITMIEAEERLAKLVPEAKLTQTERNAIFDIWLSQASLVMAAIAVRRTKYGKPSDKDIRLIATRIKEAGAEVFIPKSQFRGDGISKYRGIVETIGGKLRVYQNIEDLQNMITNPEKSIIMTTDVDDKDVNFLQNLNLKMENLRFMNFARMEDFDKMGLEELDNYEAEILSILLAARIITQEDFQDKGSPAYRMLSHLLEDYMPDNVSVESYIQDMVMNAARSIKTILKALPITVYKVMRQSVEVLWAA